MKILSVQANPTNRYFLKTLFIYKSIDHVYCHLYCYHITNLDYLPVFLLFLVQLRNDFLARTLEDDLG